MRTTILQSGFLIIALVFSGLFAEANGQEQDRRFSLSINGGISFASASAGGRVDGGFDIASKTNLSFGLGAQYTITPYWSIEGMGYYHKFENANSTDPAYENQVVSLSLRNVIHFNQLLGTNRVWENVTPYALAGFGIVIREIEDFGRDSFAPSALLGVGTGFKISDTMNFFLQYEYVATGNMDGSLSNISKKSDHYGVLVAGLRFHLGAAGAAPRSWRKPAFELTETDYNTLMALNSRVDNLERQQSSQGSDISNLNGRVDGLDSRVSANERKISDLESKFAQLDAKVRDLEAEMAEMPEEKQEDGLTPVLANGYYVQVYAANTLDRAQRVRAHVRTLTDSPVLITQRQNVYEVRIGVYDRFPAAANTLGAVTGSYSDAFVVRFPRPAHLHDDYRGIQTVD